MRFEAVQVKNRELIKETEVSRVVWIRVGALGDLLVSLRALETSLRRFPYAKFWILGSKLWTEILIPDLWPQIDGILVSEDGKRGSFYQVSNHAWIIKKTDFSSQELFRQADASVNLRIESYRFAWQPLKAMVPIRIGSTGFGQSLFYTHSYPWLGKEPNLHERDWYDGVASAQKNMTDAEIRLGELNKNGLPGLTDRDPERAEYLFGLKDKSYVIVNPTASRREKAWPREKFKVLVSALAREIEPIVVGSPQETEWLHFVAGNGVRVIQPQKLLDLFDLISGAKFLICNTSSLQFVAAAQKTNALVLMGLASPLRWGPLGAHDQVVEAQIKSSDPKISLFERERQAYESIPYEKVDDAWRGLLSS